MKGRVRLGVFTTDLLWDWWCGGDSVCSGQKVMQSDRLNTSNLSNLVLLYNYCVVLPVESHKGDQNGGLSVMNWVLY
jgi:hypothetical protein